MARSIVDEVREHVARCAVGGFIRSSELVGVRESRSSIDVALHRLAQTEPITLVRPGLYFKGKRTRFGVTRPDPIRVAYEIARDRGYPTGVGPAGVSAARALGLTNHLPAAVEVAVPGRAPVDPEGVRFVNRSPAGRIGLRPIEVAVLEMLREWPRYSEKSWDDFVQVVAGLHSKGKVNLSAIRDAALKERHRAPRQRAIRLEADVRRTEIAVGPPVVAATA